MNSLRNLTVPFNVPIPGGMTAGKLVVVQGKIPSMSQRFAINLLTRSGDVALYLSPRLKENCIIRNNIINKNWGPEETHGSMPMKAGQLFEVFILCEPYNFKISINESHFCDFSHRLPFNTITNLAVDGDVLVHNVNFKDPSGYENNSNSDKLNSAYRFHESDTSKNYKSNNLYPSIDSYPSVPNTRHSPSPSVPQYPSSGGPLYPTPGGPQNLSGGSLYPGPGGHTYSGSGGFSYPGPGGFTYPSTGGPTYSTSGGPTYPTTGGPTYPTTGGSSYSGSGDPTYPAPGGFTYPNTGGSSYPGSGGSSYPGTDGYTYPQKPSLYPTQPGYPSNPYPQVPGSNAVGVNPTPHSRPGFLDQAGAALAGVLGPSLLAGGIRNRAGQEKTNLLDEAGRALAGVIGAGLAGTGKPLKGTQPQSPTHHSGFLDHAGTALAGFLGGPGLMGATGKSPRGTTPTSPSRPIQHGSILDQAGSALSGILGGGLTGAGHHNRNKLGVLGGVLGTAVAGAALTGHLNPIKATKKQLKAHKKALKYGLPIAGAGLGAYVLHKGLKKGFHRSSSSSSSCSSDD